MSEELYVACDCGYSTYTSVGGTMNDFQTFSGFPCICAGCRSVVTANMREPEPRCPSCGSTSLLPYDDPNLCLETALSGESKGSKIDLTRGKYFCPKCKRMSLVFDLWAFDD